MWYSGTYMVIMKETTEGGMIWVVMIVREATEGGTICHDDGGEIGHGGSNPM